MTDIPKYGSIEVLKSKHPIWDAPEVVVTEKVHGTNVRIANVDGQYVLGGRNMIFTAENAKQSMGFYDWWQSRGGPFPPPGHVLYGEWYGKGIMKGVNYGPDKRFIAFDIFDIATQAYWSRETFQTHCMMLDIPGVPALYAGKPDIDVFKALIERDSVLAREIGIIDTPNLMEGIVIKPTMEMVDRYGQRVIAKLKHPKFAEKVSAPKPPPDADLVARCEAIAESVTTPQRLEHILSSMREEGVPIDVLESTHEVIKRMAQDIIKECGDDIDGIPWKQLHGAVAKRAVALYKQYLLDHAA